jgi:5-methylcytosine-specific restriction endonuclease McrA
VEAIKTDGLSQPVLVLNGNYEPLNVCSTRRALSLVVLGKASVVENGRGDVHTPCGTYPRPSVIRLAHVVRRPRPRVRLNKHEIFRRDGFRCVYCGQRVTHLTLDHVVPRHRGGPHSWDNLVTACASCNRQKGGRTPEEANLPLRQRPSEPQASADYLYGQYLNQNEEWRRFTEGW